jgi:uncharacterized membrane protein HdeD (DUF308 family)
LRGGLALDPTLLSGKQAGKMRVLLITRGVVSVLLGAAILLWPGLSLEAFALLIGAFFVVVGAFRIIVGVVDSAFSTGMRVLNAIGGLLILGLGLLSIRYPGLGLIATALFIGVAWLMEGVVALATLPATGRGWWIAFGVVTLLGGIVVLAFPWASLLPLLLVAGAFSFLGGVFDIVNGATFRVPSEPKDSEPVDTQSEATTPDYAHTS